MATYIGWSVLPISLKAWQRCCSSRPFVLVQHFCFRTDDGACEQSVQRRSSPTRTAELVLERELTRNRRGYVQVGRFAGSQWSDSRPTQTKGDKQVTIFRVGLLQAGSCGPDLGASRENGISLCKRGRESGADLCLFPEMWSIGYAIGDQDFDWDAAAIDVGDPYVGEFRDLASRLQMAIVLTFLERTPDGFRNSCALIDRRGRGRIGIRESAHCRLQLRRVLYSWGGLLRCSAGYWPGCDPGGHNDLLRQRVP